MQTIKGKYNIAKIMIDEIDEVTRKQIQEFLNHPGFKDMKISIMPDCHEGTGAVIGFTATMNNYIIPNIVGVDIGCGVLATNLGKIEIDFAKLDDFIKHHIPSGFSHRKKESDYLCSKKNADWISKIRDICATTVQNEKDVFKQIGTLGGGNHFIEIDQDENGDSWLVVHSGSRNFGLQVATYYQKKAKSFIKRERLNEKRYKDWEFLIYEHGGSEYLDAMKVAQEFAKHNRICIANIITGDFFGIEVQRTIESIHNYIGGDKIIRKGAISAHKDEELIIPFNMRDGLMIGKGKGNEEWNYSAPHGAGRIMSRRQAKKSLLPYDFKKAMSGIYTSTATIETIDEAPMVYKDKEVIINAIKDTVEPESFIKAVYNYKAN
jgi:RNA-splicing ligase RtcB